MTRNFLLQTGSKEKSWSVTTIDNILTIEQIIDFGEPKITKKTFKTAEASQQEAEKLIQKKLQEGFEEIPLHFPGVPVSTLKEILKARDGIADTLEIWQGAESDELTTFICTITSLKTLRLHRIKLLPQSIGNLHLLESLTIDESPALSDIPETLGQLTQLKTLHIGHTGIKALPVTIGQLKALRYLTITANKKLGSLPASIGQLGNLYFLTVSYNRDYHNPDALEIPDTLGDLANLERLDLTFNQLWEIPSWIASLKKLEYLEMRENDAIEDIPNFITGLSNLYLLDLEGCGITRIPDGLCKLPKLEVVNLTGNKIGDVPDAVIEDGWESIKPFLEGTLKKEAVQSLQKPPEPYDRLLKYYRTAHDTGVPIPLADFISSGRLSAHPPFTCHDRSGRTYKGKFITDIGHRMDGMVDQSIRVAVSEEAGDTEPIGFADLEPVNADEEYLYQLIVFPKYLMNSLDAEDPCPVYLVKYQGHPENDEYHEEEEGSFQCTIEQIAPDFQTFISAIS